MIRRHERIAVTPWGPLAAEPIAPCGDKGFRILASRPVGGSALIPPDTLVPLSDGDRIHLGAWTTITVVVQAP